MNSLLKLIKINFAKFSIRNKTSILEGEHVGCYFCLAIYPSELIVDWTDNDETALCLYCSVDSVISDKLLDEEDYDVDFFLDVLRITKSKQFRPSSSTSPKSFT